MALTKKRTENMGRQEQKVKEARKNEEGMGMGRKV